jgi:peptidoglycan/LPS O-acetylase OafA/YrhL
LDALRFAAIMIVFGHGIDNYIGWKGKSEFMTNPNNLTAYSSFSTYVFNLIQNFGYGVEIFFLISGLLITYLLLRSKHFMAK